MKNNKGITLISLIASVILILILAATTIVTSMNAYNQMEFEGAKAELEEMQRLVEEIASDYQTYKMQVGDGNDSWRGFFADRYEAYDPNDPNMPSGVPSSHMFQGGLIENFALNSKIINLVNQFPSELSTSSDSTFYFTEDDLSKFFGLKGIDPVVVNFSTRKVYSVDGIIDWNEEDDEAEETIYYTPSQWGAATSFNASPNTEYEVNQKSKNIEIEYIETTGTQYIMTDIMLPGDCSIEAQVFLPSTSTGEQCLAGTKGFECYYDNGKPKFMVGDTIIETVNNYSGLTSQYWAMSYVWWGIELIMVPTLNNNNYHASLEGVEKEPSTKPLTIFKYNGDSSTEDAPFIGKLYWMTIVEGDDMAPDAMYYFTPVYNTVLNKAGLFQVTEVWDEGLEEYVIIDQKFCGNSGTGDFIKGGPKGY